MKRFIYGATLVLAAAVGWSVSSESAGPRAALPFACEGCDAEPDAYPGQPAVVSFPTEPTMANGECVSDGLCKAQSPCEVEGELEVKNITADKNLWVAELGGSAGESKIGPGGSATFTYGGEPVDCANDVYVEIFNTPPGTPNRIAIAYYWLDCTICARQ